MLKGCEDSLRGSTQKPYKALMSSHQWFRILALTLSRPYLFVGVFEIWRVFPVLGDTSSKKRKCIYKIQKNRANQGVKMKNVCFCIYCIAIAIKTTKLSLNFSLKCGILLFEIALKKSFQLFYGRVF